jgi:hypothetical protein
MNDAAEVYSAGQTVIWDIYNTTGDTHPMHFHLVNVQVVGRAVFDATIPNMVEFVPTSPWMPPDPNYRGWKETVRNFRYRLPKRNGLRQATPDEPGGNYSRDHEDGVAQGSFQHTGIFTDWNAEWTRICLALPHPGRRRARYMRSPTKREVSGGVDSSPERIGRCYEAILRLSEALSNRAIAQQAI